MSVRKVVTASVAALALAVVSVPIVNAQDDGAGTGALSVDGLVGGSLEDGSLSVGSAQEPDGDGEGAGDSGSAGSAEFVGSEDSSLTDLVPESDEVCELPDLGGSVAKFYPLFGISGIPASVINLVTDALDSFPNLIEIVAGEGAGPALLGQTGSMDEALCTSIFGGEMVMPPVTVIVDEDGNPLTTVTGTVSSAPTTTRTTSVVTSDPVTSTSNSQSSELESGTGQADGVAGAGQNAGPSGGAVDAASEPVPTTVPVP